MALSPAQIAILKQKAREGILSVAEYLCVEWDAGDSNQTRYYAISKYNQQVGFANIGHDIEPRLLGDPFAGMEINPDLRTEEIPITFDDIDKAIRAKFKQFGSGIRAEIFQYFPQVDEHESIWFGQLQAPQVYGWKKITAVATNGSRSREQKCPKRGRARECGFTFGGLLTAEALASNGCPYDRHLGGSTGNLNAGVPYTTCTYDETGCNARFGHLRFYGGFKPDASAVVTDNNSGYVAVSKGNTSNLRNPIRAIYGTKIVRALQLLHWRRELNASNQDRGFVAGVWEIGEGPNKSISNFKIGEKLIEYVHQWHFLGTIGQPALTQYAPDLSNYSSTAVIFGRKGWVDPLTENAQTMTAECRVEGLTNVPAFNRNAAGEGLIGNYYSDTAWTNLFATRIDGNINFYSSVSEPITGLGAADFSIRWTGTITFEHSETYTITAQHDDGIKVIINGSTIINQLGTSGTHTGTFAAAADTPYTIQIDFLQSNATGYNPWQCILQWNSASQSLETIPSSAFANAGTSGTYRQFTNDRIWCLLDMMTNSKLGLSNPFSRFEANRWSETSYWGRQNVRFSFTNADGEVRNYDHTRTQFDCVVEGRPVAEQIVDVCRSGRLSVPFQHQGKYEITPFRAFTDAELAAAPVFYDSGSSQNVFWSDGTPSIVLETTPNDRIQNEIKLVFEDGAFGDQERPITIRNTDQQALAGRSLGGNTLQEVTVQYAAFGVRNLNEAVKLGWGIEKFGVFDEGGSVNNGRLTLQVPRVHTLDVKRYGPIRVVSQILTDAHAPKLPNGDTMEYFRVLRIRKVDKDKVEITAQVYNHEEYIAFEEVVTTGGGAGGGTGGDPPPFPPPGPGEPPPDPLPLPEQPQAAIAFQSVAYDSAGGFVNLEVDV